MSGAGEAELSGRCTYVLEGHLEVQDTSTDERKDQSCNLEMDEQRGDKSKMGTYHLAHESVIWLDVSVMGELEIVREGQSLVCRDVAEGFEPTE